MFFSNNRNTSGKTGSWKLPWNLRHTALVSLINIGNSNVRNCSEIQSISWHVAWQSAKSCCKVSWYLNAHNVSPITALLFLLSLTCNYGISQLKWWQLLLCVCVCLSFPLIQLYLAICNLMKWNWSDRRDRSAKTIIWPPTEVSTCSAAWLLHMLNTQEGHG